MGIWTLESYYFKKVLIYLLDSPVKGISTVLKSRHRNVGHFGVVHRAFRMQYGIAGSEICGRWLLCDEEHLLTFPLKWKWTGNVSDRVVTTRNTASGIAFDIVSDKMQRLSHNWSLAVRLETMRASSGVVESNSFESRSSLPLHGGTLFLLFSRTR